ncbi:hypothetical protein JBE04_06120 [Streptomyces sp. PRKS01-29]|nr:hypothetical protein [Streptomyces sabulosicollis]MBI0294072.1 hypothetical protein [Streptomyces sabulosicollis]
MDARTRYGFGRRLPLSLALCAAGAGAVMWLSPGGLGDADRVEVTGGASVSAYRAVAGAVAGAPPWTTSARGATPPRTRTAPWAPPTTG